MKQITEKTVNAFLAGKKLKLSNTETDGETLWYWGNAIAKKIDGKLFITNCGWFTNTTKERLNAIPGVHIQQKKGVWYLNGEEWNGTAIEIK